LPRLLDTPACTHATPAVPPATHAHMPTLPTVTYATNLGRHHIRAAHLWRTRVCNSAAGGGVSANIVLPQFRPAQRRPASGIQHGGLYKTVFIAVQQPLPASMPLTSHHAHCALHSACLPSPPLPTTCLLPYITAYLSLPHLLYLPSFCHTYPSSIAPACPPAFLETSVSLPCRTPQHWRHALFFCILPFSCPPRYAYSIFFLFCAYCSSRCRRRLDM